MNDGLNNLLVFDIAVKGDMLFAVTNGGGVFRSDDNGVVWIACNNGIKIEQFSCLLANGKTVLAGSRYGGIVFSSDNGVSWLDGNVGLNSFLDIRCLTANKSYIFAGTDHGGILRSDDNGITWSTSNSCSTTTANKTNLFSTVIITMAANDSCIIASSIYSIFRSTDNGMNWVKVDSGYFFTDLFSATSQAGTMFIGANANTNCCGISIDNGKSWFSSNRIPLEAGSIMSVAVLESTIYAGAYGGIVFSNDTGKTWSNVTSGFPQTRVRDLAVSGSTLFAGSDSGCFVFDNTSAGWSSITSNLSTGAIFHLAVTDSMLFAVTKEGVWRRPLSGIVCIKDRQPQKKGLHYNLPEIDVSYHSKKPVAVSLSLEQAGHLALSIYNLQGRLMTTLVSTYLGPGVYKYIWHSDKIGVGSYYLVIQAGKAAFTKRLTIMR